MRIRITRPWRIRGVPFATLDVGNIFDVPPSLAMYLRAMGCAEPVKDSQPVAATVKRPARLSRSRWHLSRDRSAAETRLQIAGRWHRLRVELDDAVMRMCSFYVPDDELGQAFAR